MDDRERAIDEARRALRSMMNAPSLSVAALERWERADERRQQLGISDEELGTEAIYARPAGPSRSRAETGAAAEATSPDGVGRHGETQAPR